MGLYLQTLSSHSEQATLDYTITTSYAHITRSSRGLSIAKIKFQVQGYDTTIIYKDDDCSQKLILQHLQNQKFQCPIDSKMHWWLPLGPSKSVLKMIKETNKRVALLVYVEDMVQKTGSTSGNHFFSPRDKRLVTFISCKTFHVIQLLWGRHFSPPL